MDRFWKLIDPDMEEKLLEFNSPDKLKPHFETDSFSIECKFIKVFGREFENGRMLFINKDWVAFSHHRSSSRKHRKELCKAQPT